MSQSDSQFDIVVVGGGHAGLEAAATAVRLGCRVGLVVMDSAAIGAMSCNPAIGGLAKGHLVREIDALGGLMGLAADSTGIQFRMLNASKGPAVRGLRAQVDRHEYAAWMQGWVSKCDGISVIQGEAVRLNTVRAEGSLCVSGVVISDGSTVSCRSVILTTGTFLDGVIHCGRDQTPAGRYGERPSRGLGDWLKAQGLETGRLKTGTPPRLDPKTICWDKLAVQQGDTEPEFFSFRTRRLDRPQIPCHITYTNADTHGVVLAHLGESAVYGGAITGPGPRYCPSLEDKCARFPDRERHQIFLEPEERDARVIYPNGVSTSLPASVQLEFLRTISGLQKVEIMRPGYAIEYTHVLPHQLTPSLECRGIAGLFLAGQINGTTGYEEAAAQGLVAGMNGARWIGNEPPVYFSRQESYLGVLVDDLVSKNHQEPYRMFTSRAEHRLLLRQDNADQRLTEMGFRIGLVDAASHDRFQRYREALGAVRSCLSSHRFRPGNLPLEEAARWNLHQLDTGLSALEWLERQEATPRALGALGVPLDDVKPFAVLDEREQDRVLSQLDIEAKYGGYIEREKRWIERRERQDLDLFPAWIRYGEISGLRAEAAGKLEKFRPIHAAAARRIAGVNPTDIALVQVHIHARRRQAA